jgi:hypothetical protein
MIFFFKSKILHKDDNSKYKKSPFIKINQNNQIKYQSEKEYNPINVIKNDFNEWLEKPGIKNFLEDSYYKNIQKKINEEIVKLLKKDGKSHKEISENFEALKSELFKKNPDLKFLEIEDLEKLKAAGKTAVDGMKEMLNKVKNFGVQKAGEMLDKLPAVGKYAGGWLEKIGYDPKKKNDNIKSILTDNGDLDLQAIYDQKRRIGFKDLGKDLLISEPMAILFKISASNIGSGLLVSLFGPFGIFVSLVTQSMGHKASIETFERLFLETVTASISTAMNGFKKNEISSIEFNINDEGLEIKLLDDKNNEKENIFIGKKEFGESYDEIKNKLKNESMQDNLLNLPELNGLSSDKLNSESTKFQDNLRKEKPSSAPSI